MEELKCEYRGCEEKRSAKDLETALRLIEMHERSTHMVKEEVKKEEKRDEKKKQEKRAQAKLAKFLETETREEFRRKTNEFHSYSARTNLETQEIADNLYIACNTPLKRRLIASSRINKQTWNKTDPKNIMEEMERICLPKLNVIVKRQQFKSLEQEEDENINGFESRVRIKAA